MSTVLIAGGSGLVGRRLSIFLRQKGYDVLHLSRRKNPAADFPSYQWDLEKGFIEEEAILKADFVINLAGAGIADRRWTRARKELLLSSRVQSALLLLSYFKKAEKWPKAFLSASGIGFYGDAGEELLDETSSAKQGFLAEICTEWEKAAGAFAAAGVRTLIFRIGIVLSAKGGALEKMLLPFCFFLGVYFGNGRQWYSWIHIDDLCKMFVMGLENESLQGVYNAVAPQPHRNKTFTVGMGKALQKPFLLLAAPAFLLRPALGEMADTILSGSKVSADKILRAGFEFKYPDLQGALRDLVGGG